MKSEYGHSKIGTNDKRQLQGGCFLLKSFGGDKEAQSE